MIMEGECINYDAIQSINYELLIHLQKELFLLLSFCQNELALNREH
jgi:hypothetical protein